MKKENTSKVLMALSMFIFGTLAPFVRNIGIGSGELALYRAIMAAVIVGGFLLFARQKIAVSGIKRELLLLLVSGAATMMMSKMNKRVARTQILATLLSEKLPDFYLKKTNCGQTCGQT